MPTLDANSDPNTNYFLTFATSRMKTATYKIGPKERIQIRL